jgi:ATP-dependent Lon protease
MNTYSQSQCPSHLADDFTKYFIKTMGDTDKNKTIDLMFEIGKSLNAGNHLHKERYIDEFAKYFENTINILPKKVSKKSTNEINKNIGSKDEKNLRLHHVDIREDIQLTTNDKRLSQFFGYELINILTDNLSSFLKNDTIISDETIVNIKSYISNIRAIINYMHDIVFNHDKNNKLSEKINKYKNSNIENKIKESFLTKKVNVVHSMLHHDLDDLFKSFSNYNNKLKKTLGMLKFDKLANVICYDVALSDYHEYSVQLNVLTRRIYANYGTLGVYLMDIYTMKRMLDKNYITNIVAYAGYSHIFNYVYFLVKHAECSVTHVTECKLDAAEINNLIAKNKFGYDLLVDILPAKILQCIDMSHFPNGFQ